MKGPPMTMESRNAAIEAAEKAARIERLKADVTRLEGLLKGAESTFDAAMSRASGADTFRAQQASNDIERFGKKLAESRETLQRLVASSGTPRAIAHLVAAPQAKAPSAAAPAPAKPAATSAPALPKMSAAHQQIYDKVIKEEEEKKVAAARRSASDGVWEKAWGRPNAMIGDASAAGSPAAIASTKQASTHELRDKSSPAAKVDDVWARAYATQVTTGGRA
ncbi:hypothetical protein [Sphingobium sp. CR28]|uniref:hypothetical protein n=1 Tax=Sphingobium sp. CR28 TaxID=3400272 RepID=UPI003FEF3CF3